MKRGKQLLLTFAFVTTGILCAATIFITVFWQNAHITVAFLWQILGVSALCSLGNFIWPDREVTKKEWIVREVLHYVYVCTVVLGLGSKFEWFYWNNLKMVLLMIFTIFIVFVTVMYVMLKMDKKVEKQLNEKLEIFRQEREKQEEDMSL